MRKTQRLVFTILRQDCKAATNPNENKHITFADSHSPPTLKSSINLVYVCLCECVRVCVRACVCAPFVRQRVACEELRHVIQRNPPPETRGSEGDSIGYKASANICPEQCKADENISSELTQDLSDLYDFIWIYHLALPSPTGAPWETHLFSAPQVVQQKTLYWN